VQAIFIRNLPNPTSEEEIRKLLTEKINEHIMGMKVRGKEDQGIELIDRKRNRRNKLFQEGFCRKGSRYKELVRNWKMNRTV